MIIVICVGCELVRLVMKDFNRRTDRHWPDWTDKRHEAPRLAGNGRPALT